ncbi:MAG: PD-(D/E)XK nuclease family protein, partial [Burkholderiales bacterium]|nr:PD-(D/E)XK nuclease family protein [Burkholderiales bacterium]
GKLEAEKESFERERLLYVATTRARQRLHLLGAARLASDEDGTLQLRPPTEKTLLHKLWPAVESAYAEAARHAAASPVPPAEAPGAAIDQTLRHLVSGWMLPAAPPSAAWTPPPEAARTQDEIEFSWVGETARHVGSVVHRWLQRIAEDGLDGWDEERIAALRGVFRDQLAARGVPAGETEAASGRVARALTQTLTDARGRWLLGPQAGARNEFRITAMLDGRPVNLVIDRLFRDADGTRWIVDYKTSSHEGAGVEGFLDRERERYATQLARYAAAAGDPQDTMLGLYFPLLAGWREWKAR